MSSKFSFSVCRELIIVVREKLRESRKIQECHQNRCKFVFIVDCSNFKSKFSRSQIFKDQGKHEAMICDRCLKELNAAFEFVERSRSAEKLYFAKLREEFEAEEQTPQKAIETKTQHKGTTI
jgi:Zinc finger, C2H2 type